MRALSFMLAVFAWPLIASAASPAIAMTIEAAAASSDRVVVGRVKAWAPVELPGAPTANQWRRISISVSETLKGPTATQVDLYDPGDQLFAYDSDWFKSKHEFLFCLVTGRRYAQVDAKYANVPLMITCRYCDWGYGRPIGLEPSDGYPPISMAFSATLPRDEVIAIAHRYCVGNVTTTFEHIVPPRNFDLPLLMIPCNAITQSVARAWARSPDVIMRWNATRVLRHTRSNDNIAAMRHIAAMPVDTNDGAVTRMMALDTLRKWNVRAPREAEPAVPESSQTLSISLIASVLTAIYLLCRARGSRFARVITATMFAIVIFATVLWFASYFDPQCWQSARDELAVRNGRVIFVSRTRCDTRPAGSWHRARSADLWAVQAVFEHRYVRLVNIPWGFSGSMMSGGEEIFPIWTELTGIAVPIWFFIAIALAPIGIVRAMAVLRRWRVRHLKGFDVIVATSP